MRAKFGCDPTAGSKKLPFNFISRLKCFFFGGGIHVLRNILVYVFRILFNNNAQQISFNSAKKWPRTRLLANKCIMEKTH